MASLANNGSMPTIQLLKSAFDQEKYEEQKRVMTTIHMACVAAIVIMVLTGTSALIYIGHVTYIAQKMKTIRLKETAAHSQPTSDNLRTTDDIIDQFDVTFIARNSKDNLNHCKDEIYRLLPSSHYSSSDHDRSARTRKGA
ncbi:hypothetical protein DICVIV_02389 [Dictyocaulus viviparus]|uniref:Uncharacterized protein n=1 Tax=Dictyocaulus viviparus TaxID=29172 RepID=A0A0D8Y3T4_DICVI|nr:hypothetical protein DICVIV_02389 [Dictyocaulus viviparus]